MRTEMLALLLIGACWGATLQAQNWVNSPFAEVQKAAKQGDANVQFKLGRMYDSGNYSEDDYPDDEWGEQEMPYLIKAVTWFRRAAEQGHAEAQYIMGVRYSTGERVKRSNRQALVWLTKAAEQGDAKAQGELSAAYLSGIGGPQDDGQAYAWASVAEDNEYLRDYVANRLTPTELAEAEALADRYVEQYQPKQ